MNRHATSGARAASWGEGRVVLPGGGGAGGGLGLGQTAGKSARGEVFSLCREIEEVESRESALLRWVPRHQRQVCTMAQLSHRLRPERNIFFKGPYSVVEIDLYVLLRVTVS